MDGQDGQGDISVTSPGAAGGRAWFWQDHPIATDPVGCWVSCDPPARSGEGDLLCLAAMPCAFLDMG